MNSTGYIKNTALLRIRGSGDEPRPGRPGIQFPFRNSVAKSAGESRFGRDILKPFRLYAVGGEQINRELEELLRPYNGM
jgi:hypothetical protein